jgi:hypothetical protein
MRRELSRNSDPLVERYTSCLTSREWMKRSEGSVAECVPHNCVLVCESARIETINEIVFFYLKRV